MHAVSHQLTYCTNIHAGEAWVDHFRGLQEKFPAIKAAVSPEQTMALFFLAPFAVAIFRPLVRAISSPQGPLIGKAVKAGVLSLILMNAAWVAAAGAWPVAIAVALLLPLSMWLARRFAVT